MRFLQAECDVHMSAAKIRMSLPETCAVCWPKFIGFYVKESRIHSSNEKNRKVRSHFSSKKKLFFTPSKMSLICQLAACNFSKLFKGTESVAENGLIDTWSVALALICLALRVGRKKSCFFRWLCFIWVLKCIHVYVLLLPLFFFGSPGQLMW